MALIKYKPTSARYPGVRQGRRSPPAQGRSVSAAHRCAGQDRRAQSFRAHYDAPHRRRLAQKYRIIDFRRDKDGITGVIERVEYDPNRTSHIALVKYADGERRYILAPKGVQPGEEIRSGADSPIKPGNAMQLRHIPIAPRCTISS